MEFKHRGALQQGLKLHHSQLDGRQINVELTAGGGGKGLARMKKLKERNKELDVQRVCPNNITDLAQFIRLLCSGSDKIPARVHTLAVPSDSRPPLVQRKPPLTSELGQLVM